MFHYLVKKDEFLPAKEINQKGLEALQDNQRRKILNLLSEKEMTVSDMEEQLNIGKQTLYYNLEKLQNGNLIDSKGSKPKYFSSDLAAYYFKPENVEPEENPVMLENIPDILEGFVKNKRIACKIVVGAPFPHGEYDRRHRTSYKAGEIAAILGNYGQRSKKLIFTDTELDNNPNLNQGPIISVAGPRVNSLSAELNDKMSVKFDPAKGLDSIITPNNSYGGSEYGFVVREMIKGRLTMMVAGISGIGTSAAIEALSSRASELGEKGAIVKGYGTKHSIEEVQIIEKL